jgi:hypothetical protein
LFPLDLCLAKMCLVDFSARWSLSPCTDHPLASVVIQWLHSQEIEDRIERPKIARVNNKTLSMTGAVKMSIICVFDFAS